MERTFFIGVFAKSSRVDTMTFSRRPAGFDEQILIWRTPSLSFLMSSFMVWSKRKDGTIGGDGLTVLTGTAVYTGTESLLVQSR